MKNKFWIILIVFFIVLGIGGFLLFNFVNKENEPVQNYTAKRTEANVNNTNKSTNTDTEKASSEKKNDEKEINIVKSKEKKETPPKETQISAFSTPIVTKDPARQNNVSITCSTLNDTIVKNGETFSFCNTVGQATTQKGYQKAEIFDAKRK